MFKIDTSAIIESEAAPAGNYVCEIKAVKEKVSKNGAPFYNIQLEILDSNIDLTAVPPIFDTLMIPAASAETVKEKQARSLQTSRMVKFLTAIGADIHAEQDPLSWVGKACNVRLAVENDEEFGPRNKVAAWLPAQVSI